jgi:hypothetical protein
VQQLIAEHHEIPIGTLTQAVIVVTMRCIYGHQTIEFVPEPVLIYMAREQIFNRRRIANSTKDFILFFVKVRTLLFRRYYLAVKISKTSAAP